MSRAYLGLGSNIGDRTAHLSGALRRLASCPGVSLLRVSPIYESAAVGKTDQPDFLNLVAEVETTLGARELLATALAVEKEFGRVRDERWGPRTIDIDLLWYDGHTTREGDLTVPHPRLTDRAFVVVPLHDLAPDLPVGGRRLADWLSHVDVRSVTRRGEWLRSDLPASQTSATMVVEEVADWPSPVELFAHLADEPHSFFLDSALSVQSGTRFSFLGADPFLTVRAGNGVVSVRHEGRVEEHSGDALRHLRLLMSRYPAARHERFPFVGGAVGYFSYEFGAAFEKIDVAEDPQARAADFDFGFYDGIAAYDHEAQRWFLIANPVHRSTAAEILERLRRWPQRRKLTSAPQAAATGSLHAGSSRADYVRSVGRIKDYIRSGDVYQVNLAQRFQAALPTHPYELYRRLRRQTAAPFGAYLRLSEETIASSSPERFLQIRGRNVETRPIKGTRRRSPSAAEDRRQAEELLASPKERAELLMIVDLERNDLGRVCKVGSVEVSELYRVESHPTVHHLVATVRGELRDDVDVFDCLRATFPGGSITGAPKVRAMQVIAELESAPRGVYTGAIGYLGFDASCELSIAIRTIVCRGSRASYHVGAGIVWDSDPESEYVETLDKGAALARALGVVPPDEGGSRRHG